MLIGTEAEKIDQVLNIIKETCHNREQYIATSLPFDSVGVGINSFPKKSTSGALPFLYWMLKDSRSFNAYGKSGKIAAISK